MLELMPNLPDRVLGVVASGEVSARDYETVLVPAVEAAIAKFGGVRVVYQIGPAFTGYSIGAAWDDMKLGISNLRAWERVAVVTDVEWVATALRLFSFAVPCPVRQFPNAELAQAVQWAAEA
ncbi:MAG: STAS/SEC14 domain-containing protein [Rhizobacter sp.]|nr:STAS/SEC14 domain-containing protein [Burkholderiaceae bacterium]MCO5125021.1 STAS/SEC14 domain-containing protein [Rhizobacter sp.]